MLCRVTGYLRISRIQLSHSIKTEQAWHFKLKGKLEMDEKKVLVRTVRGT